MNRISCRAAAFALGALLCMPHVARATHYLVDSAGGGDYSAIQPAIDAMASSLRDSILVAPGAYADTLTWASNATPNMVVASTGGAAATSARAVRVQSPGNRRIVGFTFADGGSYTGIDYWGCTFLGAVSMSPGGLAPSMHDCDFYGSAHFYSGGAVAGHNSTVDHLRFHAAPCVAYAGGTGALVMSYCDFIGPSDHLLTGGGDFWDPLIIANCTFRSATNGADCSAMTFYSHCLAQDITGDAIASSCTGCNHGTTRLIQVSDCRFERCGTAVRIGDNGSSRTQLMADTVLACTHDAIVVTQAEAPSDAAIIQGVIVDGAGGNGMDVRLVYTWPAIRLSNCRIRNTAGFGLRVVDDPSINYHAQHSYIRNVLCDHNGGPGIVVAASNVALTGNVVWANSGNGIDLTTQWTDSAPSDSITGNTVYGNTGAGIRAAVSGSLTGVDQVVQGNLVANNIGVGVLMANAYRGSVAYNDAWANGGGAYAGIAVPADSNLAVDPLLCNATAGDFGLRADSPCAPSGVYGLIGAEPVGCNAAASAPWPAPVAAFSAWPNPARGAIAFAAPGGAGGRLEVVDVLGRRVWSRELRGGEIVRWDGLGASGPLHPGVYLARFSGASATRTLRVVWMP